MGKHSSLVQHVEKKLLCQKQTMSLPPLKTEISSSTCNFASTSSKVWKGENRYEGFQTTYQCEATNCIVLSREKLSDILV
jgi:hypothetical protein